MGKIIILLHHVEKNYRNFEIYTLFILNAYSVLFQWLKKSKYLYHQKLLLTSGARDVIQ